MPRAFYVKESIHNFLVYVLVCFVARYKAIFVKFYSLSTLLCIRYSTIETKEFVRIGYNGFLLRICTQMKAEVSSRPSPEYECRKRNPLYPIRANYFVSAFTWVRMRKKKPVISNTGKFFCFNNNVSNLYNNSVVENINGMAYIFTLLMFRKPNKTTINKNKTTHLYRSTAFRFSFIFRYFKVFQVKRIVYI
jgi:hypothetical protein